MKAPNKADIDKAKQHSSASNSTDDSKSEKYVNTDANDENPCPKKEGKNGAIIENAAILFDLDGTLLDSFDAIYDAFKGALLAHRMDPINHRDLHALIGHTLEYQFAALTHLKEEECEELVNTYRALYDKVCIEGTHWLLNAKEALTLAHMNDYKIAIVTTKSSAFAHKILTHLGVIDKIDTIVGRQDVVRPKPDSEPIDLACKRLCVDKDNAVMIGDSVLDVGAGANAGVFTIGVTCGFGHVDDLGAANVILRSAFEAVEYVISNKIIRVKYEKNPPTKVH